MLTITLNNGVEMPMLGFGVFQIPPEETEQAVAEALDVGYRHLDTAASYLNEDAVGRAIERSGVPRTGARIGRRTAEPQRSGVRGATRALGRRRGASSASGRSRR